MHGAQKQQTLWHDQSFTIRMATNHHHMVCSKELVKNKNIRNDIYEDDCMAYIWACIKMRGMTCQSRMKNKCQVT
jgi:hypothetical protein